MTKVAISMNKLIKIDYLIHTYKFKYSFQFIDSTKPCNNMINAYIKTMISQNRIGLFLLNLLLIQNLEVPKTNPVDLIHV